MKVLAFFLAVFGMVLFSSAAYAEDMSIDMLNKRADGEKMVYSVDVANIDVGDTITWLPASKGHNVHFIAGPEGWELPKKSKNNKEVAITFDTPGMYLYQCTPHAMMAMVGVIQVGNDYSNLQSVKNVATQFKTTFVMNQTRLDDYISQLN